MPRIQVYLPDDLYRDLKRLGLSPSELLQSAVRRERERQRSLEELDGYLAQARRRLPKPTSRQEATAEKVASRIAGHLQRDGTRRAG